jgi:hypothetical protein
MANISRPNRPAFQKNKRNKTLALIGVVALLFIGVIVGVIAYFMLRSKSTYPVQISELTVSGTGDDVKVDVPQQLTLKFTDEPENASSIKTMEILVGTTLMTVEGSTTAKKDKEPCTFKGDLISHTLGVKEPAKDAAAVKKAKEEKEAADKKAKEEADNASKPAAGPVDPKKVPLDPAPAPAEAADTKPVATATTTPAAPEAKKESFMLTLLEGKRTIVGKRVTGIDAPATFFIGNMAGGKKLAAKGDTHVKFTFKHIAPPGTPGASGSTPGSASASGSTPGTPGASGSTPGSTPGPVLLSDPTSSKGVEVLTTPKDEGSSGSALSTAPILGDEVAESLTSGGGSSSGPTGPTLDDDTSHATNA